MIIERKLQKEIDEKREEQWKRCLVWLAYPQENKPECKIYNKDYCPMRCEYAIRKVNEPLYVNENIQSKWRRI